MRKIYHLSTCSTNRRILSQVNTDNVELINIKTQPISLDDLEILYRHKGSYEALFNKRAQKYKAIPHESRPTKDEAYKDLILSDYTYLNRPVAILDDKVIVGNSKEAIQQLTDILGLK